MNDTSYRLLMVNVLFCMAKDTRALFEKVLARDTLAPEKVLDIWNLFLEFEYTCGDLNRIVDVETRKKNAFPPSRGGASTTGTQISNWTYIYH